MLVLMVAAASPCLCSSMERQLCDSPAVLVLVQRQVVTSSASPRPPSQNQTPPQRSETAMVWTMVASATTAERADSRCSAD